MSKADKRTERTERITITLDETETGALAAEESLYDALRRLEDARRSDDDEDLHAANCEIMRAYFQLQDELTDET